MTITEFLEARIAEDEAAANEALVMYERGGYGSYGPRRVLAECAAKRAIIAEHARLVYAIDRLTDALPGDFRQDPGAGFRTGILRALAAVYKDHHDYQEAWG